MQQPTGLIIQAGSGAAMQLWTNNNVVAQTIATDGSISMPYQLTLATPPAMSYTALPTLNSTQNGYNTTATGGGVTGITATATNVLQLTLNSGVYMIFGTVMTAGPSTTNACLLQLWQFSTALPYSQTYTPTSSSYYQNASMMFIVNNNTFAQTYNLKANSRAGTFNIIQSFLTAVRVA